MEVKNKEYEAELKHFGILGMKWGKRKRTTVADRMSKRKAKEKEKVELHNERAQFLRDSYTHPIKATTSQVKTIAKHPMELLRSLNPVGGPSLNYYKEVNKDVAGKIEKSKLRKENKRKAKEEYHKELEDSYKRFNSGLQKLSDSGRGNDIPAVTGVAKHWDKERAIARAKYKQRKKAGI